MEIVLFQPEIPQNAGNILRTCAACGARATFVRPLGFSLTTRQFRRAGLDYLKDVPLQCVDSLEERLQNAPSFYFFSSKAHRLYTEIDYSAEDLLIFGAETSGLPEIYWERWHEKFYTIPLMPDIRCLNLSNAVAIVLYEAWRQLKFEKNKVSLNQTGSGKNNRPCVRQNSIG